MLASLVTAGPAELPDGVSAIAELTGEGLVAGSGHDGPVFRNALRHSSGSPDERLLAAVRQTSANPALVFGWSDRDLDRAGAPTWSLWTPTSGPVG